MFNKRHVLAKNIEGIGLPCILQLGANKGCSLGEVPQQMMRLCPKVPKICYNCQSYWLTCNILQTQYKIGIQFLKKWQ